MSAPNSAPNSAPKTEAPPPCAGVVLLAGPLDRARVLLVCDPNGHWGLPKGKREKGESVLENALRELREETGLGPEALAFVDGAHADERSEKGNLAVRYLLARCDEPAPEPVLRPSEHSAVAWKGLDEAANLLRPSRAEVLKELHAKALLAARAGVASPSGAAP